MTWRDRAACKGIPTDLFFMPDTEGMTVPERAAVQGEYKRTVLKLRPLCAECPVLPECRLSSIGEVGGMWAGVIEGKRAEARRPYVDAGWELEELVRESNRALDAIDNGMPWHAALEAFGITDSMYFYDFRAFTRPIIKERAA